MLDSDFSIERPKRYYRQGLNLLHADNANGTHSSHKANEKLQVHPESDRRSMMGSITSRVSKIFHLEGHQHAATINDASSDDSSDTSASIGSRAATPMLDPSTNTNALSADHPGGHPDEAHAQNDRKRKKHNTDVSKHTFYIVNSQMRLKLFARNEVCIPVNHEI